MGMFSWKTSDTDKSISNVYSIRGALPVYVLIPKELHKEFDEYIYEPMYEGYGEFCGVDIYNLVADMNRKYLAKHPEFIIKSRGKKISEYDWYPLYANLSLDEDDITDKMKEIDADWWEYRVIGINLACADEDNANLPYPIKITEYPSRYETAAPSDSCEYQGFFYDDNNDKE